MRIDRHSRVWLGVVGFFATLASFGSTQLASRESQAPRGASVQWFVANRGHFSPDISFYSPVRGGALLFGSTFVEFREHGKPDLRVVFVGARSTTPVHAEATAATRIHELTVGGPRTDRVFTRLRYEGLWPGVDLVFHAGHGGIKYEFHVAPDVDPRVIAMRYPGCSLDVHDGDLVVCSGNGRSRTDPAPVSFQCGPDGTTSVACRFALDERRADMVSFCVGPYDPDRPLVIDPVFTTFAGFAPPGAVGILDVAVDANGATWLIGLDTARDLNGDVVIAKVRPDGSAFEFVSYLGAPQSTDVGISIAVDSTGVYVGGHTMSDETVFPVKHGPSLKHAGLMDAFVCKLALDGKTILYCGYVGGSGSDGIRDMAVDAGGAVWLAGQTTSTDYPTTGGPQLAMPGLQPGSVTKIAPDGRSLVLSGYLGGANPSVHYCYRVVVGPQGNGYVIGITASDQRSFPVVVGPALSHGGGFDAYVAKVDGQTGALVYAGFIGGGPDDFVHDLAVDSAGAAYVVGETYSDHTTFPVVGGPVTTGTGGYLSKVRPNGGSFEYSGFLGGVRARAVGVDRNGRCYVAGLVGAIPNIPIGGALSSALANIDGILLRLSIDGRVVEYAGFLGGFLGDSFSRLAIGTDGSLVVAGDTDRGGGFPVQRGPNLTYSTSLPLAPFVTRIAQTVAASPLTTRPGMPLAIDCVASEDVGVPYQVGTALSGGPIPMPGGRRLELSPDGLLQASVLGALPGVFQNYTGTVPQNGQWTSTIQVPPFPALVGVNLFTAFLTFAPGYPGNIKSISNATPTTIVP